METIKIDLENYRTKGSKVFTGRERGRDIREKSEIDKYIKNSQNNIEISIPNNIMSVNPSFLEEFLHNVVIRLGKKQFYERVSFTSNSTRYNIDEDLEEAVDRILRINNALTK